MGIAPGTDFPRQQDEHEQQGYAQEPFSVDVIFPYPHGMILPKPGRRVSFYFGLHYFLDVLFLCVARVYPYFIVSR